MRGASILLLAGAVVVAVATAVVAIRFPPDSHVTGTFAGLALAGVSMAALGVVITFKVPGNVVGTLVASIGAMTAFFTSRDVYYAVWREDHTSIPLSPWVIAVLDESSWWLIASVALLVLLFPDGRLPSRRWRVVPVLLAVCALSQHLYGTVARDPFGNGMADVHRPWELRSDLLYALSFVSVVGCLILLLACAASLIVRFRRSHERERAQLKWLVLAGIGATLYPIAGFVAYLTDVKTSPELEVVGVLVLVALPTSITIAMLRHDLFDIDRVIADTISYLAVVVVLLGTYAVLALGLGLVLGRHSAPAAAAATAVCALLLSPLRRRVQRVVDNRLYPVRRAALQAIEDLQRRVHTQNAQPEELESVLRTAMRDPGLRVGLLVRGTAGFVGISGSAVPQEGLVPVTLGGVQIGAVSGSQQTPPAVLRDVAAASASMIEMTRLRAELTGALRDVEASRNRLVLAGDAERRHLERDLHDGAQQRLVALGMAMRVAQHQLGEGDVDVNALLDRGVAELGTAVAELRQIAHGLRPTSLEEGLRPALAALTRQLPIPVRLRITPDQLDEDLVTTAYYVAAEAITNAAKYASASAVAVSVEQTDAGLEILIRDDGCGGAEARTGSGLAGLADRVAAVGGTFRLKSPIGGGTIIEAVLPCGS